LKLIADCGLVGLPNAGKSTFLASVTAAKPKIADYPFTTLHPHLGVVRIDGREFVLADIPGLIEGAHEGVGIGDRFLGHVERCQVLLHLVSAQEEDVAKAYQIIRDELEAYGHGLSEKPEQEEDVAKAYQIIRDELEAYGHGLSEKPEVVALSQIDILDEETKQIKQKQLEQISGKKIHLLSAVTHAGIEETLRSIARIIEESRKEQAGNEAGE